MPETSFEAEQNAASAENAVAFDPVCVDVPRIYDSCGAKDCLRDLTVFFTDEDQELIESATSVRVTRVNVLTATVDVDAVAFHRGYYSVDETFYFLCCCEVYTGAGALPANVNGIAVSSKRVVLYGSDGCVKRFTSGTSPVVDPADLDCCNGFAGALPTATVQVSSPMALAAQVRPVTAPVIVPFVSKAVTDLLGGELAVPVNQQIVTTIGIFSITALSRDVQLMLPSYDFCMPGKECDDREDDPCETFSKIEFPTGSFFPPGEKDIEPGDSSFDCHCG